MPAAAYATLDAPFAMNLTDYYLLTLPEASALAGGKTRDQLFAMSFIKAGSVMGDVAVKTRKRLRHESARYTKFNTTDYAWADLSGDSERSTEVPEPYAEVKYRYWASVDVPQELGDLEGGKGISRLFSERWRPKVTILNSNINERFFNNSHGAAYRAGRAVDMSCFVGIRPRLLTAGTSSPWSIPAEARYDAAALDLSSSGISGAKVNLLGKYMDDQLEAMGEPEGDNVTIYVNQDLGSRINYGIRDLGAGGGFSMVKDAFDREQSMYKNAKIKRAGRVVPDSTGVQNQIISSTEDATGAVGTGGTFTSMFFVKSGDDTFFIEKFSDIAPGDPFLLDDGVTLRTVMMNYFGLIQDDNRALAQIYDIKVA